MNNTWIIWSVEHCSWWRPNHRGYTEFREEAGEYTYEEAISIVTSANIGLHDVPNEAMIPYKSMKTVIKEAQSQAESDLYDLQTCHAV